MADYEPLTKLPQPHKVAQLSPQAEHFKAFKGKWSQEPSRVVRLAFSPTSSGHLAVVSGTKVGIWTSGYKGELKNPITLSKFKEITHCASWRNDGKLLLVGDAGGTCHMLELETKKVLRRFRDHGDVVSCASFASADKSRVATGARDGRLRTWDVATGELLQTIDAHSDCMKALSSGAGGPDAWLTAGYDGRVRLWDLRVASGGGSGNSACVFTADHGHPIEDGVPFPSGSAYASAGGPVVKVWDLATCSRPLQVLEDAHSKTVMGVCLDSIASVMLTASFDGLAKVFSAVDLSHLWTYRLGAPATCAAWRPDDLALAVGLDDGRWSLRRCREFKEGPKPKEKPKKSPSYLVKTTQRGIDAEPAEDDMVIEMPREQRKRMQRSSTPEQVNFFLRKFEYRKVAGFIFAEKTLENVGFAIVEELMQRGELVRAFFEMGEELCLQGLRWLRRAFSRGDALQHRLFEEALHAMMDHNSCLNPPSTPQLMEAVGRLELQIEKEVALQEMLVETSGMVKCVMSV